MTTFQEPPLQSRRAARQNERADAPPGGFTDPNSVNQPHVLQPPASSAGAPAASYSVQPPLAEPLNYATTTRPPLPQYDGQNLRPRRTAEPAGHADLPPTEALPRQDAPSYRPKDYSPEGRRSMAPAWAPSYDGTVDYQTQNRDQISAASATPGSAPIAPASEGEHTMTRRELRALREAEGITAVPADQSPPVAPSPAVAPPAVAPSPAAPAADTAAPAPAQVQPPAPAQAQVQPVAPAFIPAPEPMDLVPPPLVAPAPQTSSRLDSALAEFDALAAGREPVVPAPDAPAPLPGRRAAQAPADAAQPPADVASSWIQQAPTADEPQDSLSAFEALFAAPPAAPAPTAAEPAPQAVAPVIAPAPEPVIDPLLSAPAPQGAPALVQPPQAPPSAPVMPAPAPTGPGRSSVGHWSTQSDLDEAEQVTETTITRSVGAGSGAITTSALVLPSVPDRGIAGPMNGSGEILLTGSISLPHSYSSTGVHPSRLDESDLDHLLDPGDQQVVNTDSMPVRAVKAVSTHTATGAIIAPTKQPGTRGFTILIVAASAMAVVVVGLLVAGLVSGTL